MVGNHLSPAEQGAAIRRQAQEEAREAQRERSERKSRNGTGGSFAPISSSLPKHENLHRIQIPSSTTRRGAEPEDYDLEGDRATRRRRSHRVHESPQSPVSRRDSLLSDEFEGTSMTRSRSDLSRSVPPPHLSGIAPERRQSRRQSQKPTSATSPKSPPHRDSRVLDQEAPPTRRHNRQASGQSLTRARQVEREIEEDDPELDEDMPTVAAAAAPSRTKRSRRTAAPEPRSTPKDSNVASRKGNNADELKFVSVGSAYHGGKSKQKPPSAKRDELAEEAEEEREEEEVVPASPTFSRRRAAHQATNGATTAATGAGLLAMGNSARDDRRRNYSRNNRAQLPPARDSEDEKANLAEDPSRASARAPDTTRSAPPVKPTSIDAKGRVYSLTGIDNLALLLEDDGYQTACFSVYLFKTQLDYDTVLDFFLQLAQTYPKYRYVVELDPSAAKKKDKAAQKGNQPPRSLDDDGFDPGRKTRYSKSIKAGSRLRPAKWRLDESFEIEDNIQVVKAPGDGRDEDLFDLCGQVLGTHFDYSKPLWEAVLVHGLRTSEGARSGLMIKIHHAFSDGQGMIQSYHSALEALSKGKSIGAQQTELDRNAISGAKKAKAKQRDTEKRSCDHEQKNVGSRGVKTTMLGTVSHSWHTIRGLYFRKRTVFTYSDKTAKSAVETLGGTLAKNLRPSGRFYAHSDGIKMEDIKLIRKAYSSEKVDLTLNDVACALLSRALRIAAEDVAVRQGKKVKDKRVAVFIPVSKRPPGDWSLANYTTGAIAWFRFHSPDKFGFEKLVQQCNREMTRIKKSHLPTLTFNFFSAVCKRRLLYLPNYPIARSFFQRAYTQYCVFTNIPGPSQPVRFGKHEAFSYHCLPPSSPGRATMAIGTISYAGAFSLAVSCDAIEEWDDAHLDLAGTICDAFQKASQELIDAAKERLGG